MTLHRWHIDDAQYERHEQRRGRRQVFESLDAERTALVADANAAINDDELDASLHTVYRSFADVRTTAEVIDLIDRSATIG